MIPTLVQNVGLRVGKRKICQCPQGATNSGGNSKSKKNLKLGSPRRKISAVLNLFIFFVSVIKSMMNIVMLDTILLLEEHFRSEVLPSKLTDTTMMMRRTKVIML